MELQKEGLVDKIPDMLWADCNPLPCKELQEKINVFYLPINYKQNFSRFMKFDIDEKLDLLSKLKNQY
jgi:hypothetical protein